MQLPSVSTVVCPVVRSRIRRPLPSALAVRDQTGAGKQRVQGFGEGGIRTRQDSLDSATYGLHVAVIAVNAVDAVAACTLLQSRPNVDGNQP